MKSRGILLGLFAVLVGGWMASSSIAGTKTTGAPRTTSLSSKASADDQTCKMGGLEGADQKPIALASCFVLNGSLCSTVGSRLRCSITPNEPGLCICQTNHTYFCQ